MAVTRLVVASLGFDEKLVVRSLIGLGLQVDDVILLVYVEPFEEISRAKVLNALKSVVELFKPIVSDVRKLAVSGRSLRDDLVLIAKNLKGVVEEKDVREVVVVLVGGMRILIPLLITSTLLIAARKNVDVSFIFAREDGLYSFTLGPEYLKTPSVGPREAELLKVIHSMEGAQRGRIVEQAVARLGVAQSMVYRMFYSLQKKGLIEVTEKAYVRLTPLGRALVEIL